MTPVLGDRRSPENCKNRIHYNRLEQGNALMRTGEPRTALAQGAFGFHDGGGDAGGIGLSDETCFGKVTNRCLLVEQKVANPSDIEVSGDIVAPATTWAGLVLVFLGATYSGYASYPLILRDNKVRDRFRRRAWFAFVGFALALFAALRALLSNWLHQEWSAVAALVVFGAAVLVVAVLRSWTLSR